jgi:hypothetical protein
MDVDFEINRHCPYQVPLSFDDAAMDVLDWLESCPIEWDMYVDLPANTVRYCSPRRMRPRPLGGSDIRRKGELWVDIDRKWPHQVVLPACACEGGGYNEIHEFHYELSLCSRGTPCIAKASGTTCTDFQNPLMRRNSNNVRWRTVQPKRSMQR